MNLKFKNNAKKYISIALLLCAQESLMAQPANYIHIYSINDDMTYDISIAAGRQSMVANEILHNSIENHTNSKLIWDTKSLSMIGLSGALHFKEKYTLNLSYWFSATKGNSKMTDYDWENDSDRASDWTHRSIHSHTDVSKATSLDINAEFKAYTLSTIAISPILGYRQDSARRKAYGGNFIYSEDGGFRNSIATLPNNILGGAYKQTWKSPYIGLKADTQLSNDITLHSKIIYSPSSKVETLDNHYLRDIVGTSKHDKTRMYAINLGIDYKLTELLGIKVNYMYQKFNTATGDLKWDEKGTPTHTIKDFVQANLKTSLVSISLNYKF